MVTCIPLKINESPDQHIRVIDQPVKIMHPILTVTFNNEGNTLFPLVVCIKVRLIGLHPPPLPSMCRGKKILKFSLVARAR